jgi:glycerol uptake facilitator protein
MKVLFGSNPPIPGEVVMGGYTNVVLGWGLAVTFGINIAGTVSGAHLNPAVTMGSGQVSSTRWSARHYWSA